MDTKVKDFINGLVAGWTQVFIMQPFDRIKVMMQNNEASGIFNGFKTVVKEQGVTGFYKGTLVLLVGIGVIGSVRFGVYENIRKDFKKRFGYEGKDLPLPHQVLAGFCTGLISSILVGPIEHMRTRIQVQKNTGGPKLYNGSLSAAVVIAKNHGLLAIWKGQVATWTRQSSGLPLYFSIIEYLTAKLTPQGVSKVNAPWYVPMIAGGVGGTSYWVFNYPVDFVKTRMQSDSFENPKYKGFIDCFRQQYNKGFLKMYKGYTICLLRSFPVNAGAIFMYRLMQRFWSLQQQSITH